MLKRKIIMIIITLILIYIVYRFIDYRYSKNPSVYPSGKISLKIEGVDYFRDTEYFKRITVPIRR